MKFEDLEVGKKYYNSDNKIVTVLFKDYGVSGGYALVRPDKGQYEGKRDNYEYKLYKTSNCSEKYRLVEPPKPVRLPVVGEIWLSKGNNKRKILDIDDNFVYVRDPDSPALLYNTSLKHFCEFCRPPRAAPEELFVNIYTSGRMKGFKSKEEAETFLRKWKYKEKELQEAVVKYVRADLT